LSMLDFIKKNVNIPHSIVKFLLQKSSE